MCIRDSSKPGDKVTVNYIGRLYYGGNEFDNSYNIGEPFALTLGNGDAIAGFDEGATGMRVGAKREVVIPPNLAYGSDGAGDGKIPPNATPVSYTHLDVYKRQPYLHTTRNATSLQVYGVEMTEADHRELADILNACRSTVVLSGYPSELYHSLYQDWKRVHLDIANHSAGGKTKSRMTEVLWIKPA